jgi:bifunctional non-homologous end joining protein LigD
MGFTDAPEPAGRIRRGVGHKRLFVVQKHDASRLHYDFRLEIDAVVASWAVPKGPSLDPAVKRLATRTEDHPIEYADFEGVIPEGQCGAGIVMVWDIGTYEPGGDLSPEQQLRRGEIKAVLHGEKLRGGFLRVRTDRRSPQPEGKTLWLLIKQRDEYADSSWQVDDRRNNRSVRSGRTLTEIGEGRLGRRGASTRVKGSPG